MRPQTIHLPQNKTTLDEIRYLNRWLYFTFRARKTSMSLGFNEKLQQFEYHLSVFY